MGQTLSEPITVKDTQAHANAHLRSAASSMQGWRINMEDCHTQLLSMKEDKDGAFFAVFDGHGGANVAKYCGDMMHKQVVGTDAYQNGDYVEAFKRGFLATDEEMLKDDVMKDDMSGSTAICVLIKDSKIYCGNAGDSRAISSVAGICDELSFDHKPSDEMEAKRIVAAGGWVEFNRVNGNLALSRAMGDFVFKRNSKKPAEEQIVTCYPDVITKDITKDHEFIVLACDGIWDVMSNQEVVDFVRARIAQKLPPEQISEELLDHCLAPDSQLGGLGCDNMTAIIVCLLQGQSYDALSERCSIPVTRPLHENETSISNQSNDSCPTGGNIDDSESSSCSSDTASSSDVNMDQGGDISAGS